MKHLIMFVMICSFSFCTSKPLLSFDRGKWVSKPTSGPRKSKTAILCHGFHLQSEAWEDVIWGDSNKIGRLPKAIQLAIQEDASLLVIGSGGSFSSSGLSEGEFTLQFLKEKLSLLNKDGAIQGCGKDISEIKDLLRDILVCETSSVNTKEELESAGRLFFQCDINKVILVSSPTHLPRCLRDAMVVFDKLDYNPILFASPSQTCYANATASDVCIVEPPHRGDRNKLLDGTLAFHKLFSSIMKLPTPSRIYIAQFLRKLHLDQLSNN